MTTFRVHAVFVIAIAALAGWSIPFGAQSAPAAKESASTSVRIEPQKGRFAVGEKPIVVVMTIKNTSQREECFSTAPSLYRIHVTIKDSEPSKTEFHRHLRGEFRSGDGPDLAPGPVDCRPIAPGAQDSQKFDLAAFYDLSDPGDYNVYIEIYDPQGPTDGSGLWLRTNTARFEIEASPQ
jgi:hypothetical protein